MRITANGISMQYTLNGPASAPVVTLSHSLATNLAMWEPQAAALAARYRVLRYDTRGHGGTDAPAGPYSLDQLAEDAVALLRALGIERTHFVGLSMGGMIGQVLALKHPEMLRSLVLCDTSSRISADARPMWDDRIRVTATDGMLPHVEPTIGRWFTASFVAAPRRGRAGAHHDPADEAAGVHRLLPRDQGAGPDRPADGVAVPTLIVVGEDDPGTPVAASRAIHERIKGSALVILKSASHLSNIEQAEAFNRTLTAFLAAHDHRPQA